MSNFRNIITVIFLIALAEVCFSKYHNYDKFDIEVVLSDQVRSKRFFECIRNESTCTTEDKEMKHDLMEMLATSCAGCTDIEKRKLQDIKRRAMDDPEILNLALGE